MNVISHPLNYAYPREKQILQMKNMESGFAVLFAYKNTLVPQRDFLHLPEFLMISINPKQM